MKHIELSTGFVTDIPEERFDDYELFEWAVQLESGDSSALMKICDRLLREEKKSFLDFHRREDGVAPFTVIGGAILELIKAGGEKK